VPFEQNQNAIFCFVFVSVVGKGQPQQSIVYHKSYPFDNCFVPPYEPIALQKHPFKFTMKIILHFTSFFCVLFQSITTAQPVNNLFAAQEAATASDNEVLEINISVLWYNEFASSDACSDDENQFIADMITPNLNFQLNRDDIASLPWQAERGNKNGKSKNKNNNNNRELQGLCHTCRDIQRNPISYCNALHNCSFTCRLCVERKAGAKVDLHELGLKFNYICMDELGKVASNRLLSDTCKAAIKDSLCETKYAQ